MSACVLTASSGCSSATAGQILIPLRFCVVKGAELTAAPGGGFTDVGSNAIDGAVQQAITDQNLKIWIPGANISFYAALYAGTGFNVPVINDPQPPAPKGVPADFTTTGPGLTGDIYGGGMGLQRETQEMRDVHQACITAWSRGDNANKSGIVVVIARDLVDSTGQSSGSLGVGPGHSLTAQRNSGADLCLVPRHLLVSDVADQYALLADPAQFNFSGSQIAWFYTVLAHELGHALLESHGDGLNNGGTLPPANGPRKFNQDCGGTQTGNSLMTSEVTTNPAFNVVTSLEAELARDAAVLVPGHSGPL